jgi:cardiolipin synthase
VDVRVIYDGVGCAATLPMHYPQKLREAGIRCQPFQPFRPLLSIHQNNRDHRKLCVIDGWVGYCSGLNLADEYVGELERFGDWKDNAIRLEGNAAWSLAVFFLTMWATHREEDMDYPAFRPRRPRLMPQTPGFVVPYADTPMDGETVCADLLLQMITKAKRYCYLTTPYLVIDETLTAALCTAARSGVDVRIMTPHIPDKKVVFAVTRSNYPPLLEAGCRVFEYSPGFLHSKVVVADDLYASVGSCNLDYRSLYLQFENGVWLCGDPAVAGVKDDFLDTQRQCQEIFLQDCQSVPLFSRLLCTVYRIFSPLF